MVAQREHQGSDLLRREVHQDGFREEQQRLLRMHLDRLDPGLPQHRPRKQMVAFVALAEQFAATVDHLRHVQVVPLHPTVVDPLESGVEAAADVHDHRVGMAAEEILRVPVHFAGEHAPHHVQQLRHRDPGDRLEVVTQRPYQRDSLVIVQQGIRTLGFHRPPVEGCQRCLGHPAQVRARTSGIHARFGCRLPHAGPCRLAPLPHDVPPRRDVIQPPSPQAPIWPARQPGSDRRPHSPNPIAKHCIATRKRNTAVRRRPRGTRAQADRAGVTMQAGLPHAAQHPDLPRSAVVQWLR